MFDSLQWSFVADMNYSGSVTISDIWLWFKWIYFYPGDGVVYFIVNKATDISHFLEMTYSDYGGIFSGFISFFVWLIASVIIVMASDA